MTREEAIKELKEDKALYIPNGFTEEEAKIYFEGTPDMLLVNALDMAIEALKQEPCEDCISREAALEAVKNSYTSVRRRSYFYQNIYSADKAIERIKILPSVQPKSRWIPCSERLPNEFQSVLVCVSTREANLIAVSYRIDYNLWEKLGRLEVAAWMPLPEPYRREE